MENRDKVCELLVSLVEIMERLRAPNGCPWDAKQTKETIRIYLLEEAYEVLEAIEKKDPDSLCEELGDLFFQIIFLCQLAKEKGEFNLIDVLKKIRDKMIRRHPHVFGNKKVKNAKEVSDNWAKIKMQEKKGLKNITDILDTIPHTLPALLMAHRISERVSKIGFDWKDKKDIWDKVKEEYRELSEAIYNKDMVKVKEEIGDLIFSLVNLARHWEFNAEDILRETNKKFFHRFNKMVAKLNQRGIDIDNATIDQMNEAWEDIKKNA